MNVERGSQPLQEEACEVNNGAVTLVAAERWTSNGSVNLGLRGHRELRRNAGAMLYRNAASLVTKPTPTLPLILLVFFLLAIIA